MAKKRHPTAEELRTMIDIMIEAREQIENDNEEYICYAIMSQIGEFPYYLRDACIELITQSLAESKHPVSSVHSWCVFNKVSRIRLTNAFVKNVRLKWLDAIIEDWTKRLDNY